MGRFADNLGTIVGKVVCSDFGSLGQRQSVVDVHAKVPNCVLDLAMAKQYLDGPKVAGGFVNERRLRTAQRMSAVLFRRQPDSRYPLVHQPGVLTGAQVSIGHNTAWEGEVIDRPTAPLKPAPPDPITAR